MRKKIRFYKQHSMETCGPACMLMLLDLYGKIEYPTQKQEMKLYSLYRSNVFNGVNGAAIANCLSSKIKLTAEELNAIWIRRLERSISLLMKICSNERLWRCDTWM